MNKSITILKSFFFLSVFMFYHVSIYGGGSCESPDGAFFDYDGSDPDYATANSNGWCYNNLPAGTTVCYTFWHPDDGTIKIRVLQDESGCSCSGISYSSSGCTNSTATGRCGMRMYDQYCKQQTSSNSVSIGPTCSAWNGGQLVTLCVDIPAGCSNYNICPMVECVTGNCGVNCVYGTWVGSTSTSWNTAANWCMDSLPNSSLDITIPSGTTFAPTIGAVNAACKDLTVNSGATLTVSNTNATYDFDIYGDLVVEGTLNHSGDQNIEMNGTGNNFYAGGTLTTGKFDFVTGSNYTSRSKINFEDITISGGTLADGSLTPGAQTGSQIGTGTSYLEYTGPFRQNKTDWKSQGIYRADALRNSGLTANSIITGIQFKTFDNGSSTTPFQGFQVKIGHTDSSAFKANENFITPPSWTTARTAADYTTGAAGWQAITFDNNFTWNGTDNILIEICWNNSSTGTADQCYYEAVDYLAWCYDYNSDNSTAGCDYANGNFVFNYRPFIKFDFTAPTDSISPNISGDLTISSGTYTANDGTITLNGSGAQAITSNSNAINNLVINKSGGNVTLSDALTVNGDLVFSANSKVVLGNNNLTIGSSGSISGNNSSRYIVTDGTGLLRQEGIGSGSRTGSINFPVGSSTSSYTPISIDNSTGTADRFDVKVCNGAYDDGNCSGGTQYTENVINKTWTINEGAAGGSDASITFQWNGSDEATNFDRANCRISHYSGGWEFLNADGAAAGADPYTRTVTGVSSFSPFGVGGGGGNPLPIELTDFNASIFEAVVQLSWKTASEYNNDYFTLERSADGITFEELTIMEGAGTSFAPKSYSYIDPNPLAGTSYYRLKQTDFDGTFVYHNMVAVNFENTVKVFSINVYPNPVDEKSFNIEVMTPDDQNIRIILYNAYGEEVFSKNMKSKNQKSILNIETGTKLQPGIYILTAEKGETLLTKKLIFQ